MLDSETKKHIDNARNILVGIIPDPKAQVDLITLTMIYKFMDDMDREAEELGKEAGFLVGDLEAFRWGKLMSRELSGIERLDLYVRALQNFAKSKNIPPIFRHIFKDAYLPFRDPETLSLFIKEIDWFSYDNSENLGNAFEYLLSVLGSQGNAGQFRTPRHIIDFITEVVDPNKTERILDPACGTAGFLISAYKHIQHKNSSNYDDQSYARTFAREDQKDVFMTEIQSNGKYSGDLLTADDRKLLADNIHGYDISPDMVRLSLVNLYLHNFVSQNIDEYNTLTSDDKWDENFDVILANPPFMSPKGGIRPHKRFQIQANRAEVLFVDYITEHLTINGRAGIIVPEGIIFQSSGAYKDLRKMLVDDGYLSAVVSLPSGVFQPYSGVKTSILFFDRQAARASDEVCFIKVENDGFDLGAQRRRIKENDLPEAYEALTAWRKGEKIESKNVSYVKKSEIAESGDYNLTGERYKEAIDYSNVKWDVVELDEIFHEIKNGKNVKQTDVEGNYRVSRIQSISQGVFNIEATKFTNDDVLDKDFLEKGDILFSHINSYDHLAKTAIFELEERVIHGANLLRMRPNKERVIPKFALLSLKSGIFREDAKKYAQKAVNQASINCSNIKKLKIPLPPLEIQEQIVEELEGYQAVIDGARKIVENWKPTIKIKPDWEMVELGEVCSFEYGKSLPKNDRNEGGFPVMGSNGRCGFHDSFLVKGPAIIIGRKGSAGEVIWEELDCFPIDTTYFAEPKNADQISKEYLYYLLKQIDLTQLKGGAGIPGLNRNDAYRVKIFLPKLEEQKKIVAEIETEQKSVEAARELIAKHEVKIEERISELWGNE